jgi:succinate dehydrogenase / fumarate reductase cytochrome b subunit
MSSADLKANRPLSPHLQIYHWAATMFVSIAQRATGMALYFGTILLAWWLLAAATGPEHFRLVSGLAGSWIGLIVLFGYTWSLMFHALGGIRYFIWDTGRGMGRPARDQIAVAHIVGSIVLTILLWVIGLLVW